MAFAKRPDTQDVSGATLSAASIDAGEVERFQALAETWWDPNGKMGTLHKFNPVRLEFIRDRLVAQFQRDAASLSPFVGLSVADIGCGGGLVCEPMARLGASVTGVDAAERNVKTAALHASDQGLAITYRHATAETLAAEGARFDVVLSLEVVEHVADLAGFVGACCALVRPGGVIIIATLNRTLKSLALAKFGAEYVLRWLPIGTHDWRKFVRPSELVAILRANGFVVGEMTGLGYDPLRDRWRLTSDVAVSYMVMATRPMDA